MSIKKISLDERMNYVTIQLELLLQKEIERNKELDKERAERKEREAQWEAKLEAERAERDKERAERDKERAERDKERAERDKERAERDKERAERKEREAQWEAKLEKEHAEQRESIDKFTASQEKSLKKLKKLFGDYGLISGREAEFTFKLAIKRQKLICGGLQFDTILSNVRKSKKAREYDLILINGSYVALIEVKRTASIEDVSKLVEEQVVSFRADFPQYQDKTLVCFLAAYVAIDEVVENAKSLGVGVLLQNGFDIKEEILTLKSF